MANYEQVVYLIRENICGTLSIKKKKLPYNVTLTTYTFSVCVDPQEYATINTWACKHTSNWKIKHVQCSKVTRKSNIVEIEYNLRSSSLVAILLEEIALVSLKTHDSRVDAYRQFKIEEKNSTTTNHYEPRTVVENTTITTNQIQEEDMTIMTHSVSILGNTFTVPNKDVARAEDVMVQLAQRLADLEAEDKEKQSVFEVVPSLLVRKFNKEKEELRNAIHELNIITILEDED